VFLRTGGAIWWKLTGRPGKVDWSGGVFASCMPRVQLYVNACNGWPQFALQHHWLLPINCHFLRLYIAAGRGISAVSSAIEESDLYLFYLLPTLHTQTDRHRCLLDKSGMQWTWIFWRRITEMLTYAKKAWGHEKGNYEIMTNLANKLLLMIAAEGGSVAMASEGRHATELGREADRRLLQRRFQ